MPQGERCYSIINLDPLVAMIEPSSQPCFLGWYKPGPDGQTQIGLTREAFAHADIEQYNHTIGVINDIRPPLIDFLALEGDYEALMALGSELCAFANDGSPVNIAGVEMVMAYARTQRTLSNFLNAARAFVDRALHRLSVTDGQSRPSREWNRLQQAQTQAFEQSFAVRVMTHLARYALHQPSPVTILPVSEPPSGEGEPIVVDMRLILDVAALMASDTVDARLRVELNSLPDKRLDLLPLAEDFMKAQAVIMLSMIEARAGDLYQLERFEARMVEETDPPEGAIPIIWQGPHPEEGTLDGSAYHFCFEESRFLFLLAKRLSEAV